VGIDLCGFAGRGISVGLGDDLYATALLLDDGRARVAVLHLDLIGVEGPWAEMACRLIARQGRLPAGNILLCCTHTHYGPTTHVNGKDPATSAESAYMAELKFKLAGAVEEARRKLGPVIASVGRSTSDIGVNRRERLPDGRIILGHNPEGPIDREVIVVRLDRPNGEALACLLNFAAHPVSQGGRSRLISPDFPGPAREVVEALTGATCLYLQGACGNINSVTMREGLDTPRTLGKRLGAAAVQAYETAQPASLAPLGIATREVALPAKSFSSLGEARRAVEELEAELASLTESRAHRSSVFWTNLRLTRARECLTSLETGEPLPRVPGAVWAVAMGEIGLATGPGEIFCEIGLAVKRGSPLPHTMYVSNTNGSIGYVPVPEAYPEGGYEVSHASRVGPEAAGMLNDTALALLERAHARARRRAR
jgi:hypothetical protein